MSLSATIESLYPIGWSYYSTPSVPKYSPRRLQLHNFIHLKVLMAVQLVLDDHIFRGFGITPIWSSHDMVRNSISKGPLLYLKHEITRLCCPLYRRPLYMEGNRSTLGYKCVRDLRHCGRHCPTLWMFYFSRIKASTSRLHVSFGTRRKWAL